MSAFDDLVGQDRVRAALQSAARWPQTMTHAWLLTGPPGSGRSIAARAFAAALQCEDAGRPGCGVCAPCHTTLRGSHPDVIVVATTQTFIRVEQARELALAAAKRPMSGRWRIVIVEDADRLNEQAGDALLKTLEEPPPRTVWLLCAPTLDDLIVTVRSRCRHVRLGTPPVDAVADLLVRRDGVDPAMAHYAARAAQSHIGVAKRLATDEAARSRRRWVTGIPLTLTGLGHALAAAASVMDEAATAAESVTGEAAATARAEVLRQVGADPNARSQPPSVRAHLKQVEDEQKRVAKRRQFDSIDAMLTDLSSVYRDALVWGSGADVEPVNANEVELVRAVVRSMFPEELLLALEAISLARARLLANGSPLLVVESLMVALTLPRTPVGVRT